MLNEQKAMEVRLKPGLKGFVSGVVNSEFKQLAFVEVKEEDGTPITSTTFEGQGERVQMDTSDSKPNWSFGPLHSDLKATVYITIYHYNHDARKVPSQMIGPIPIDKEPEPGYPMEFHSATVISNHGDVATYDKCTISVVQYKE